MSAGASARTALLATAAATLTLLASCSSAPEKEQYIKLDDPKAVDVDFRTTVSFHVDNGAPTNVKIHVDHFSIGGKDIALLSEYTVSDGENAWIQTQAYGRMKVTCGDSKNGCDLWLTPSQRTAIAALHGQ
jgi:hypothetical protein